MAWRRWKQGVIRILWRRFCNAHLQDEELHPRAFSRGQAKLGAASGPQAVVWEREFSNATQPASDRNDPGLWYCYHDSTLRGCSCDFGCLSPLERALRVATSGRPGGCSEEAQHLHGRTARWNRESFGEDRKTCHPPSPNGLDHRESVPLRPHWDFCWQVIDSEQKEQKGQRATKPK